MSNRDLAEKAGVAEAVHKLDKLVLKAEDVIGRRLRCIAVFGSTVYGGREKLSDVDVIVVVDNTVPDKIIRILIDYFNELIGCMPRRRLELFLWRAVGAYRCVFVTREIDLEQGLFHKVYNVSRVVSMLLAPSNIVRFNTGKTLLTIKESGGCSALRSFTRVDKVDSLDIVKSLLISLLLVTVSLFLYPLSKAFSTKLFYESLKWTTMNTLGNLPWPITGASVASVLTVLARYGVVDKRLANAYMCARRGCRVPVPQLYVRTVKTLYILVTLALAIRKPRGRSFP